MKVDKKYKGLVIKKFNEFYLVELDKDNTSEFNNLPVSFGSEKSVMSDLHSLSLCDFNIGPPSSFGTWLSWHGKVPRLTLQRDMKIHSIDQFVISSTTSP